MKRQAIFWSRFFVSSFLVRLGLFDRLSVSRVIVLSDLFLKFLGISQKSKCN